MRTLWKWTWDSNNTIAIYEPTDGLQAKRLAHVFADDYDCETYEEDKVMMEATATLICESVNKALTP